jgi:hypothetical protein
MVPPVLNSTQELRVLDALPKTKSTYQKGETFNAT